MSSLDINIKSLQRYNPELCKKLKSSTTSGEIYELKLNLAGEYNLLVNGVPIHSVTCVNEEAKEVFTGVTNDTKNVIHIIYGLGLGYTAEYFAEHAKGITVVFEPDINLLKFVFENADFTSILNRDDFFLVSDIDELKIIFAKIYKWKKEVIFSTTDYYRSQKSYKENKIKLENFAAIQKHYYEYQSFKMFSKVMIMAEDLDEKIKLSNLKILKGKFKDIPAIIVSAGPSLHKNISTLKANKDKALIFSVGTAAKALYENEIVPDFINYLESFECRHQLKDLDLSKTNLITEPAANRNVFYYQFKNKFLTTSYESNFNHLFSELTGTEQDYFEAKGTVAYHALYSAKYLGCNPIILLGQDLAYSDGKCYAKGTIYEGLECNLQENGTYKIETKNKEKFKQLFTNMDSKLSDEEKEGLVDQRISELNQFICTTKSIDGKPIPTSKTYKLFCSYFEDFAERNKNIKLINASSGAYIEGFEHKNLEEIDLAELKKNIPNCNEQFCSTQTLISNLNLTLKILKENYNWTQKQYEKLKTKTTDTQSILQMLQKSNEKRTSNMAFRLITLADYNELSYLLRENYEKKDKTTTTKINEQARAYLRNTTDKIKLFSELLEKDLEKLNESCHTKS